MRDKQTESVWASIIEALTYFVIGRQVKTDKKGREFFSFKFDCDKTSVKSVVVYLTKKNDVRILANVGVLGKGIYYNKRFFFLLKNINEEQFFLISGKQRMNVRDKADFLELLKEGRQPSQYETPY